MIMNGDSNLVFLAEFIETLEGRLLWISREAFNSLGFGIGKIFSFAAWSPPKPCTP